MEALVVGAAWAIMIGLFIFFKKKPEQPDVIELHKMTSIRPLNPQPVDPMDQCYELDDEFFVQNAKKKT